MPTVCQPLPKKCLVKVQAAHLEQVFDEGPVAVPTIHLQQAQLAPHQPHVAPAQQRSYAEALTMHRLHNAGA